MMIVVALVLGGLGSAAATTQTQVRGVDFTALINERLDQFIALLEEEIPDNAGQLVKFIETARTGLAAGQTQPARQSFGVVITFLFALIEAGAVNALQMERFKLALALVADSVILAFPEEGLALSVGLYVSREKERVIGPFLGECIKEIRLALPTGEESFRLQTCKGVLPSG
jgi:hypothetical protein